MQSADPEERTVLLTYLARSAADARRRPEEKEERKKLPALAAGSFFTLWAGSAQGKKQLHKTCAYTIIKQIIPQINTVMDASCREARPEESFSAFPPGKGKRESGEEPERSGHCKRIGPPKHVIAREREKTRREPVDPQARKPAERWSMPLPCKAGHFSFHRLFCRRQAVISFDCVEACGNLRGAGDPAEDQKGE